MIKINGQMVEMQFFPDGTPRLRLQLKETKARVEWLYEQNEEMILFYLVNHLRQQLAVKEIELYMPYIPNARMDRVKNSAEVFTLKYFSQWINSLNFDRVVVRDAHSSVSLALLDRVVSEDVFGEIRTLTNRLLKEGDILFYPDEGSCKRYADQIKFPCCFGIKKRDWETGEILGLEVNGSIPDHPFDALIIDDISSYGGTFFHSAKKLKELGAEKIYLYVTHCENAVLKGELTKCGLIEKIYTTKSIYTGSHPLVEVIGE